MPMQFGGVDINYDTTSGLASGIANAASNFYGTGMDAAKRGQELVYNQYAMPELFRQQMLSTDTAQEKMMQMQGFPSISILPDNGLAGNLPGYGGVSPANPNDDWEARARGLAGLR